MIALHGLYVLVVDIDLMVAHHSVPLDYDYFYLAFNLAVELRIHSETILNHFDDVCALTGLAIEANYTILRSDHAIIASADRPWELQQLQLRLEPDRTLVLLSDQIDRDLVAYLSADGITHHLHVPP